MNGLQPLASRFSVYLALVSLVLAGGATFAMAQGRPTIAEKTEGMEVLDGFFPMYWDGNDGTLWMEMALTRLPMTREMIPHHEVVPFTELTWLEPLAR